MRMPNSERAVVDIRKLRDYCLSPEHPRGRHKARVFAARLGLTADKAGEPRGALLAAAGTDAAVSAQRDTYGQRYLLDFVMETSAGWARVRSSWMVRTGEDFRD